MMPIWLLNIWHGLSVAAGSLVLILLCWHALRPGNHQSQADQPEPLPPKNH